MANKTLVENEFAEIMAHVGYGDPQTRILIHQRLQPDPRATFAMALLERWGMVTASPDGEDSAGRQKIRSRDADETVKLACEISDRAFAAFADRGWLLNAGSLARALRELSEESN